MSDQFSSDEEVLARLVREAGDPNVSPDPKVCRDAPGDNPGPPGPGGNGCPYDRVHPESRRGSTNRLKRTQTMKRIAKFAVAATILVALGILASWMTISGGSTNVAFARVADALNGLKSATYDVTSESKGDNGQPSATATGKGFFLGPSHQRIEIRTILRKWRSRPQSRPREGITLPTARRPRQRLRPQPRPRLWLSPTCPR